MFFAQIDLPNQVENLIRIGVKTLMVSNDDTPPLTCVRLSVSFVSKKKDAMGGISMSSLVYSIELDVKCPHTYNFRKKISMHG